MTTEEKKEVSEEAKAKAKALIEKLGKLNTAQKLALSMGLPYETPKQANGGQINQGEWRSKNNHRTFRNPRDLAIKKKDHARRVGRPK